MSLPTAALSIVLIASSPQSGLEQSVNYYKYPKTHSQQAMPNCYVQTGNARSFDLTRLCGFISSPSATSTDDNYSGGGSSTGVCNVPSDRASDGSRCGGRAASRREGGR
jgi:hypothetical protein